MIHSFIDYGLSAFIQSNDLEKNSRIGRIIKKTNHTFSVVTIDGVIDQVKQKRTKKEKKKNASKETYAVGDYVTIIRQAEHFFIDKYFERKNVLSKVESPAKKDFHHKEAEQLLASNIDEVFVTLATDQRFTLSKLERYLMTFSIPKAQLTVLITKADYHEQADYLMKQIKASELEVEMYPISIYEEKSINYIREKLSSHSTGVLLGASGTGKSTLINHLINRQEERTDDVRRDGKGKHTTTYSTLVAVPTGGYLIDTPGFKAIAATKKVKETYFEDIIELARYCKFRDCKHQSEPQCAVKAAVEKGTLNKQRLESYLKYTQ